MELIDDSVAVRAQLDTYRTERDALLKAAKQMLQQDNRVCSAWLFGSIGRGEADALSDLDLFVVVADEYIDTVVAQRQAFAAQLGQPLLLLEAPQNAPPHGAYLMAWYEGQSGPHQVDWYWQAQFAARIPQQTLVLFSRVSLPHLNSPPHFDCQPVPEQAPDEAIKNAICSFWVMLLITAKYVARSPWERGMGLLTYTFGDLEKVRQFVGAPHRASSGDPSQLILPADKLMVLRQLAEEMEELMPLVTTKGGSIPIAVLPSVYRYLQFVESIAVMRPKPTPCY